MRRQAIQLGLIPRLEIRHTSGEHFGQIYMPRVNLLLLLGVLLLVLMFRSSSALASAYGIAVSTTISSGRGALMNVRARSLLMAKWRVLWVALGFAMITVVALGRIAWLGLFEAGTARADARRAGGQDQALPGLGPGLCPG